MNQAITTKSKSSTYKILIPFIQPFRWQLAAAFGCMMLDALFAALRPWPLKVVIDRVIGDQTTRVPFLSDWINDPSRDAMNLLYGCCLATLLIALGTGGFTYLYTRIMGSVSQRLVFNLRSKLFSRMQRLSLRYHYNKRLGDSMARLTTDIDAIQMLVARGSMMFFSNLFLMVAMLLIMFWLNWKFTLIACSIAPVLLLVVWRLTDEIKRSSRAARDQDGVLASLAQESLTAIEMVKGMAQESHQNKRFEAQGQLSLKEYLNRIRTQAKMAPIVDLLAAIGLVLIMYYGTISVLNRTLTVGDIVVYFAYVTNFFGPMRTMARQAGGFAKASAGADRVAEVLATKLEVFQAKDAQPAPSFTGQIELQDVSFQYEDLAILQNFSLSIQPGESIALVGPTGAGKSTVTSLILRFYDPTSGVVKIDGFDIKTLKTNSIRRQIGLVLQNAVMLKGTIRDNIVFGCPYAPTDEQIEFAARQALVTEFTDKMPLGLDSEIFERGTNLSGGQRQRIAIARAILKQAPILILDEPTSSLDIESERVVLQAIKEAALNRTTLMITHRLAATQMVDRIVVMKEGQIVEEGNYHQLIQQNGFFAAMVANSQDQNLTRQ